MLNIYSAKTKLKNILYSGFCTNGKVKKLYNNYLFRKQELIVHAHW